MKQPSVQQFAMGGMLVAAVVVLVLAGFAWSFAQQTVAAAAYVGHTHRVKGVINDLESSLYRAEAGQRAYLATRNTLYRSERNVALESLGMGLAELARLAADNPDQIARLRDIRRELEVRSQLYRKSEALIVNGTDYSPEQRIDLGARALSGVRPLIDAMNIEEDRLLAQRETAERERARASTGIFGTFVALLLILLPTIFWHMYRDLQARQAAEVQVTEERAYDAAHARALTLYNAENKREAVLDGTLALLGKNPLFPVAAFYAQEEWGGALRLVASRAAPGDIKTTLRMDEGPIGAAARSGEPVYLEGFDAATGLRIETGLATLQPAAVLMCPVQHQGRLLGVLALAASARLGERDREFVNRLCAQLAGALHNLGQLEELALLAEQLRSRGEDIQRKNAELERANRMKSEFLANMSHELRTPLNAIIGFSEIMKDGLTGPMAAEQLEYVGDIHSNCKHLLLLINDILDLSKVEAGHVLLELDVAEPGQLATSAMSVLRERASSARVRFTSVCPPGLGALRIDLRKAKQIVYNLVSNALKFTPEGGTVALSFDSVSAAQVSAVQASPDTRVFPPTEAPYPQYLEIRVSDSGIGISPDNLQQLFQAFVQIDSSLSRQYTGTGLGLTLVRRLAELHGGGLMVHSREGSGSVFTVWLPWREVSDDKAPVVQVLAKPVVQGELLAALAAAGLDKPPTDTRVLVVDDDPKAMALVSKHLQVDGYNPQGAYGGQEGLGSEMRPGA